MLHHRELTKRIIGLAIEVHRHTGPGLLESFYAAALCRELERAGIRGSVSFSVCEAFSVSPTIGQATVSGSWSTRQVDFGC